ATSEQVEIMVSSILKAKSSLADLFSFRSHVRATRNSDLTSEQPEIVIKHSTSIVLGADFCRT
ncbi:unnamed protein product, partial [Rotaria magnacalcarata]